MKTKLFFAIILLISFVIPGYLNAQFHTRLLSTHLAYDDSSVDSLSYIWSGNRSGVAGDELLYDTMYSYHSNGEFDKRIAQSFDDNNNILVIYQQDYSSMDGWRPDQEQTMTYNGFNLELTHLHRNWSISAGAWNNYDRTTTTYDGQGRISTQLREVFSSGIWENSLLTTNTYGANQGADLVQIQDWNETAAEWQNYITQHFTYGADGHLLNVFVEKRDLNTGIIENYFNRIFEYDSQGLVSDNLNQLWDENEGSFKDDSRYLYTYNADSTLESQTQQLAQGGILVNWEQEFYYYEAGVPVSVDYLNWTGSGWGYEFENHETRFYYDGLLTSISKELNRDFVIYPNPATDIITISSGINKNTFLDIFDVTGHIVFEQKFNSTGNPTINIGSLIPGIYFMRINGSISKAFIKQ